MSQSIYIDNGYDSRTHYLRSMSEDYAVPMPVVSALAEIYCEDEDFDGLVSALEDYHEYGDMYYGDM